MVVSKGTSNMHANQIYSAPTSRRFRFGLRTMFVVVVIVAIPCAWMGYSLNWIRQRREIRMRAYSYGMWTIGESKESLTEMASRPASPILSPSGQFMAIHMFGDDNEPCPQAPKGLWLFGESGMAVIAIETDDETEIAESEIARIRRLFPEVIRFEVWSERVTDGGVLRKRTTLP